MIPYFTVELFYLGPVPIRIWGLLVAAGILIGLFVSVWAAKKRGLDSERLIDMAFWVVLSSLVGGRLVHILLHLQRYIDDPVAIFKIWQGGMTVTGGFIGAALAAWLYLRAKKLSFLEYGDAAIFGLPVGLWIGRLGCFFVYDHPGTVTSFFLGQHYADGLIRHNHGLYLSINGLLLAVAFFILLKQKLNRPNGFYIAFFLVWYGVVRFILDFFRAYDLPVTDPRYLGLTVAQYTAILMVALGGYLWYFIYRKKS